MATDDSYEIMPYKEIVLLKKQIAELQQKTGDTSSKELLASMASLTKSMNNMLQLFSSAAEEMKLEEKTEGELSKRIEPLIDKVDRIEEHSKTIAEGLVAVANMIKDMKKEKIKKPEDILKPMPKLEPEEPELPPLEPMPPPEAPPFPPHASPRVVPKGPMPPPGMPPPPGGPMPPPLPGMPMPPPGGPPPPGLGELPPLPPLGEEPKKKKGMFGLFKKK